MSIDSIGQGKTDRWLIDKGYENVEVISISDTTFISYENRIFRYEVTGFEQILINAPLEVCQVLIVIPKYQNMPMLSITIPYDAIQDYRSEKTTIRELRQAIAYSLKVDQKSTPSYPAQHFNKSYWKYDFTIGPVISGTQFGNYDAPIKIILDAAPTLNLQMAKGLSLTGQLLIPVINNFSDDKVRAGIVTLNQAIRLPYQIFAQASVGLFNHRRYGAAFSAVKYTSNGIFGVGTTVSYTSWSPISGNLLSAFYEKNNLVTARINASLRWPAQDLVFNASYGSFLYQDVGIKIEAVRQFGETRIGLYALRTSLIENAGFSVLLTLPTKKYKPINRLRLRTQRYFDYTYRFRGQTFGGFEIKGGYNIIDKLTEFQPTFFKNQVLKYVE